MNAEPIRLRYAYYPGCSLHSTAKDYDISTKAVCKALGIELTEIPGWVCCGASSAHMTSELLSLALPIKSLVSAREMGLDTVAPCAACYSRLKVANETMRSGKSERLGLVDQVVGGGASSRPYRGESRAKHLLEVVSNDYGIDALEVYEEHQGAVRAVLLDITMPRMGGEETLIELRRRDENLPVVLSSGYDQQDATNRFFSQGAAGFIQKPYRVRTLLDMLRGVLGDS